MKRYYASGSGRFGSPDQGAMRWSAPSSLNRYIYTEDDPIDLVDPDGNEPECLTPGRCGHQGNDPPPSPLSTLIPAPGPGPNTMGGALYQAGTIREWDHEKGQSFDCVKPTLIQRFAIALTGMVAKALNTTFGTGMGASAAAGVGGTGPSLNVSQQLVVGPDGKAAFLTTIGGTINGPTVGLGRLGAGLGAVGGFQITTANTQNIRDLAGNFVTLSTGVADTVGASIDVGIGAGNTVQTTLTIGVGGGGWGGAGSFQSTALTPICDR